MALVEKLDLNVKIRISQWTVQTNLSVWTMEHGVICYQLASHSLHVIYYQGTGFNVKIKHLNG